MTISPPGRTSFPLVFSFALALGVSLGLPGVGAGIASAQVKPLGPNEIPLGNPYKMAWDQADTTNISYWRVYTQATAATARTQVGGNVPLAQLLNGGVVIELPAVMTPSKAILSVVAVNDPDPGKVTLAESLAAPGSSISVEYLKPVALPPTPPTNFRKMVFSGQYEQRDNGEIVLVLTLTPVVE